MRPPAACKPIADPTGVLAATRLLSTEIQQELDHERYTET